MSILVILIPIALGLGLGALWLFLAGARSGQFDDLETPAYRILFDDSNRGDGNEK
jgi:cbb3-type cytochrome oxidase maturation protein